MIKHISDGTLIGPAHIEQGLPNQDYARAFVRGRYTILALADGAGSLPRSDEGAILVVEQFLAVAEALMEDYINERRGDSLSEVFMNSLTQAIEVLSIAGLEEEGGCTFVGALITEGATIVGAVGDSFAVIETSDDELHLLQPPAAGEFVNITKLVTSDSFTLSTVELQGHELKSIAICSDAFDLPTLKDRVPVAGFWSNIFKSSHEGEFDVDELLYFMQSKDKLDDDATAIVASFVTQPSHSSELVWRESVIEKSTDPLRGLDGEID